MHLSPGQCRAARGYLGWTQQQLADRAQVSRSTVASFEARIQIYEVLKAAMRTALESEGVVFPPWSEGRSTLIFREADPSMLRPRTPKAQTPASDLPVPPGTGEVAALDPHQAAVAALKVPPRRDNGSDGDQGYQGG